MSTPRRGEVWLARLDPTVGREQAGARPVLILSIDSFNAATSAGLVAILPITSTPRPNNPVRIEIRPPEGGLANVSYVIGEQTRTISTQRLVRPLGATTPSTMAKVSDVVRMLLGL